MFILLVEDDRAVATVVSRTLAAHGHEVRHETTGERALQVMEAHEPILCLLDLTLPGIDGLDVLEAAKAAGSRVPFIVLTGDASLRTAVDSMRRGATDFLTKPFSGIELLKSVEMSLARCRAERENDSLRSELQNISQHAGRMVVGNSPAGKRLLHDARKVATTRAPILITGPSGTGKSLLAERLHAWSNCAEAPFVAVSCAALPGDLIESELFGYEKGAFTGAVQRKPGRFETAARGTVFLDEIGEMPLMLQPKLLRVLQSGEFEPLGGTATLSSNARVIAATNRDLRAAAAEGSFREDLYYRLDVVTLRVPSLSERREDIPDLARYFVRTHARVHDRDVRSVTDRCLQWLAARDWPGNIRELSNAVEKTVVLADSTELDIDDFQGTTSALPDAASQAGEGVVVPLGTPLADAERLLIESTLDAAGGVREDAARMLGLSQSTLYRRLREYRVA